MAWAAVAVAGVGLVSSFMGKKSADKGYRNQERIAQEQLALDREQLDWGKQTYRDWQEKFDPAYASMMSEIDQDIEPNYGMIAGDTKAAFQTARESNERNMMRYGIDPRDGSMEAMNRDYGIREAASHVGNRAMARENSRGILWNRKANVTGMLSGMQTNPMANVRAGYNSVGNTQAQRGQAAMGQGITNANFYSQLGNDVGGMIGGIDWQGIASSVRSRGGSQNSTDWSSVNRGTYPSGPPG